MLFFLCLCSKNIVAETLDNKEPVSEAFDLPVQIIFEHHAAFANWFIITSAPAVIPQGFLTQYLEKHENSPPG